MKINNVNITLINPKNGLIGFTSFVLYGAFYVNGIAIYERLDRAGYRLLYPTRKSGEQVFNICHPINRKASQVVDNAVFQKLKDVLNESCKHVGHDCH